MSAVQDNISAVQQDSIPISVCRSLTSLRSGLSKSEIESLLNPLMIQTEEMGYRSESDYIYPIESDYFIGNVYFLIANISPKQHFLGKQRLLQFKVQGKFKQSIPFSSVYVGQCWDSPLSAKPPSWLVSLLHPGIL